MAVTRVDTARYVGKSSDIKPLDAPLGSVFYEYDTEAHYDKTVDPSLNNGWKLRATPSTSADNVKSNLTTKTWLGRPYIVIMAGVDAINIETGDLLLGIDTNGKLVMYQAKENNPADTNGMIIFNEITGFDPTA